MTEDLKRKVETSIKRLQDFAPKDGQYYLAFSGGKDSVVCKALCDMAGVKYDAHYRVTSVDPPELVKFIKDYHPDVEREIPRYKDGIPITMWNLVLKNRALPTRLYRFCCKHLKEDGGDGRKTITGVRWAESVRRTATAGAVMIPKKQTMAELEEDGNFERNQQGGYILTNDNDDARRTLENCYKRSKIVVNPIIEWTDKDVWEFIHEAKIPHCSLYKEGWERLGCIGCPMGTTKNRAKQFARWPKYEKIYRHTIDRLLDLYKSPQYHGKATWNDQETMWRWWLQLDIAEGQIGFDEIEGSGDDYD